MAYSIEAAMKSDLFEEVMVSTDDDEIAEISIKHRAEIPFMRNNRTSDDYATTIDVVKEDVSEYSRLLNHHFESICCIYHVAPLISIKHLTEGLELLNSENFKSVFPVISFGYPVWRGLKITEEGKTEMVWPEFKNTRSQDKVKVYHDHG